MDKLVLTTLLSLCLLGCKKQSVSMQTAQIYFFIDADYINTAVAILQPYIDDKKSSFYEQKEIEDVERDIIQLMAPSSEKEEAEDKIRLEKDFDTLHAKYVFINSHFFI